MPLLTVPLLRGLIAEFEGNGGAKVIYPATPEGEQRNPVLWPRKFFPDLAALSGGEGAKARLKSLSNGSIVVVSDAAAFADVDTPADLESVTERLER